MKVGLREGAALNRMGPRGGRGITFMRELEKEVGVGRRECEEGNRGSVEAEGGPRRLAGGRGCV